MDDHPSDKSSHIDMHFISRLEGSVAFGYVPTHRRGPLKGQTIGQSGVTIGVGCDLGRRTESSLLRLGLPAGLIGKLKPYLGKRCADAQEALARRPLRLSDDEAAMLSSAVAADIFERLAARYNRAVAAVPTACPFHELPWQAQTVIASVAYQYGENLPRATPRFWAKAVAQDWPAVVEELENFGDSYAPRRKQEAQLLRQVLTNKIKEEHGDQETSHS